MQRFLGRRLICPGSTALIHAKKLINLSLLIGKLEPCNGSVFSFHIASGLTKELIESAIMQKESEILALCNLESSPTEALKASSVNQPTQSAKTNENVTTEQVLDLNSYRLRIQNLKPARRLVFKLVVSSNGITAEQIAETANLSIAMVRVRLRELEKKLFLTTSKPSKTDARIRTHFLTSDLNKAQVNEWLASSKSEKLEQLQTDEEEINDVRKEEIDPNIQEQEQKKITFLNAENNHQNNDLWHTNGQQINTPLVKNEKSYIVDFTSLHSRLSSLPSLGLSILKFVIASGKATSKEIYHNLNCDNSTVHRYITKLLEKKLVDRFRAINRKSYIYIPFPGSNLTVELIDMILSSDKSEIRFHPSQEDSSSGNWSSSNEILNQETTGDSMRMEPTESEKQSNQIYESIPNLGKALDIVREIFTLRRKAASLEEKAASLEEKLRAVGGKNAEELLVTLFQSEKF